MIESADNHLDVDTLMQSVRAEALLRRQLSETAPYDAIASDELLDTTSMDGLIAAVARRCEPRTELPPRLRFFPFTVPYMGRAVLKFYNHLFREQRVMHGTMVTAVRELVAVNRELYRRVALLEARLQREHQPSE